VQTIENEFIFWDCLKSDELTKVSIASLNLQPDFQNIYLTEDKTLINFVSNENITIFKLRDLVKS
jgi:hypothetical protein